MKKIVVLLFLFCLSVGTTDDSEGFAVTIITSPSEGPFRIGQQVNFSCVVDPEPPDSVTYQWRSVERVYGGNPYSRQNFSRHFYSYNLRFCWYFCEVLLNQTLIGSASRLVELSGIVYPTSPVVTSFRNGDTRHILNVNISEVYFNYISSLAWYHNGTRIVSGRKFTISNNNTLLAINDMRAADAGVYEVKIAAVNTESSGYSHDPQCDIVILPLLELLSAFAPVTFTVQESCVPEYNPNTRVLNYQINETNEVLELRSISQINNTLFRRHYSINGFWARNGHLLPDNAVFNSTISIDTYVNSLLISYNESDAAAGNYVGALWTRTRVLRYFTPQQCRGHHYTLDYYIGIYYLPLALSYWRIITPCTKSLSVNMNMQQSVLSREELTAIWCTSECENTNLTLWRNGELLSQVQGSHLNYTTTPYMYGSYQCGIGDKISNNTFVLQERAYFQILFNDQQKQCSDQSWRQRYFNLKVTLSNVFSSLCFSCQNISISNIQNMQVNCTEFMYLTADLVYSDPAGRITASTLLSMLSTWILSQETPSLVVNGQNLPLIKTCSVEMNVVTRDACIASVSTEPTCSDKLALISGVYSVA